MSINGALSEVAGLGNKEKLLLVREVLSRVIINSTENNIDSTLLSDSVNNIDDYIMINE